MTVLIIEEATVPSVEAEVEVLKAQVRDLLDWKIRHEDMHREDAESLASRLHKHGNSIQEALLFKEQAVVDFVKVREKLQTDLNRFGTIDKALNSLKLSSEKSRWTIAALVAGLLWILRAGWDAVTTYMSGGHR